MQETGADLPAVRGAHTLSVDATFTLAAEVGRNVPEFLDSLGRTRNTRATYETGLKRFVRWLRNTREPLTKPTLVPKYKDYLEREKYSAYTTACYVSSLRRFFDWCADNYDNFPVIGASVKCSKPVGHARGALTLEQAQKLLGVVDTTTLRGKRDYALLWLFLSTGLRRSEARNALIGDLVEQDGQRVLMFKGKGRVDKNQAKVLEPPVYEAIQDYLGERARVKPLAPGQPLFASLSPYNPFGKLSTMGLSRIVKGYLREIGLDDKRYTCHSLRHTAITLCYKGGRDVVRAQLLAGHSNINTTMGYVHEIERLENPPERVVTGMLMKGGGRS